MERIITCFATGYRQLVAGDNGLIFISFLLGIYVLRYKINPTIGIHSGGDQPERLVRFAIGIDQLVAHGASAICKQEPEFYIEDEWCVARRVSMTSSWHGGLRSGLNERATHIIDECEWIYVCGPIYIPRALRYARIKLRLIRRWWQRKCVSVGEPCLAL